MIIFNVGVYGQVYGWGFGYVYNWDLRLRFNVKF
jgi:hypothetical protein